MKQSSKVLADFLPNKQISHLRVLTEHETNAGQVANETLTRVAVHGSFPLESTIFFSNDPQLAFHILRVCSEVSRLNHIFRTTPLHLNKTIVNNFDNWLRSALERIHNPLSDISWKRLLYHFEVVDSDCYQQRDHITQRTQDPYFCM